MMLPMYRTQLMAPLLFAPCIWFKQIVVIYLYSDVALVYRLPALEGSYGVLSGALQHSRASFLRLGRP